MRVLAIPDFHQNVPWARGILHREANEVDRVVFLGDFFDCRVQKSSTAETCLFLDEVRAQYGEKIDFLKGNHDVGYYYLYPHAKDFHGGLKVRNKFPCSGFTSNRCFEIAKHLSEEFIKETKLAVWIDDVLYTHAGARPELFNYTEAGFDIPAFLKEVDLVNSEWQFHNAHPFFWCGHYRGGFNEFGGLLWCDFNGEFIVNEHLPKQICGHTADTVTRQRGQNLCLDAKQTAYAIVTDGVAQIKYFYAD